MATKKASTSAAATKRTATKAPAKKTAKTSTTAAKTAVNKSSTATRPKTSNTATKAPAKKAVATKSTATKATAKKAAGRKYSPAASKQVEREMREMKEGKLRSGSTGQKITNPKQAIAIGLSEARRAGKKVPPNPNAPKKK